VTTVFTRLVHAAEVRSFPNGKGRRVWEWIAEPGNTTDVRLSTSVDDLIAPSVASISGT
jgi:hypothetical protein